MLMKSLFVLLSILPVFAFAQRPYLCVGEHVTVAEITADEAEKHEVFATDDMWIINSDGLKRFGSDESVILNNCNWNDERPTFCQLNPGEGFGGFFLSPQENTFFLTQLYGDEMSARTLLITGKCSAL